MNKKSTFVLPLLVTAFAPALAIVSCSGHNDSVKHYKLLPTYAGQADQLIALGIKSDYYPLQLDQKTPFTYLTDSKSQISKNHDNKKWVEDFSAKVKSLIPVEQGTAWWNQQALEDGEKGSDPEYWTHRGGDLVLYEHYLLDDGAKTIDNNTAPKHYSYPSTFVQTNFRQSRDPYTRIPKNIISGLFDQAVYDSLSSDEKTVVKDLLNAGRQIEELGTEIAVDGEMTPSGIVKQEIKDGEKGSWLYNDFFFARSYHKRFLDNSSKDFDSSEFKKIVLDSQKQWIFDKNPSSNASLANLFYKSTYQPEEDHLKTLMMDEKTNPQLGKTTTTLAHHPIYDQQVKLGAAPMFEGAMRDNSLYFYDLASQLQEITQNKINDEKGFEIIKNAFAGNDQWKQMLVALENANTIQKDLATRYAKIKILVDKLDLDKKKFGLFTLAPGGGVSTIQSSSKYSFLYRELGFSQPLPLDFASITPANGGTSAGTDKAKGDTLFNMDDNGWWWNVSHQDENGENDGIDSGRTNEFGTFDYGFVAANDTQYNDLKAADKNALSKLYGANPDTIKVDYNLWNEGIKTPFCIHMVLDQIVDQLVNKNPSKFQLADADVKAAYDWGSYFTTKFIQK